MAPVIKRMHPAIRLHSGAGMRQEADMERGKTALTQTLFVVLGTVMGFALFVLNRVIWLTGLSAVTSDSKSTLTALLTIIHDVHWGVFLAVFVFCAGWLSYASFKAFRGLEHDGEVLKGINEIKRDLEALGAKMSHVNAAALDTALIMALEKSTIPGLEQDAGQLRKQVQALHDEACKPEHPFETWQSQKILMRMIEAPMFPHGLSRVPEFTRPEIVELAEGLPLPEVEQPDATLARSDAYDLVASRVVEELRKTLRLKDAARKHVDHLATGLAADSKLQWLGNIAKGIQR